ncbi:cupin domain-containing protein [Puia sp.]|jgi:quercetin dioxygenase-like cupin family protein|uniref:cupin domain-containing protein n=1 Tax=Puia sp. TaxID=2045100 RepID=UPI002F3EA6B4
MKPILLSLILVVPALFPASQATAQISIGDTVTTQTGAPDTLTAGVAEWDKAKPHPTKYGETRDLLTGVTRDLSWLDIHAYLLAAGKSFSPAANEAADHLLIVREGSLTVTIGSAHKVLGPGGIALFSAGEDPSILNTGTANATCYLLSFRAKGGIDKDRAKQAGPPVLLDWPELTMKKTDKGESRPIFSRPVAWLHKIDMHATTLEAGQISHPQHVHRNEEIILMRSGHVRMHIADGYQKAAAGDLVFLPSGVPHNLENGDTGRCEYFALQWEQ